MNKRIWELDAFRGICILGMVIVHFVYDLVELYGLVDWKYPAAFSFVKDWGGLLFLLISGVCVTMGHHPVRRGLIVFACGLLCSLVTAGMYLLDFADRGIIIYFGVLHCLGACMLLWPLWKKCPTWGLALGAAALLALGYWFKTFRVEAAWLFPLGLRRPDFTSSDYFPLLPSLGWFLLGAVVGRTAYGARKSLLPRFPSEAAPVRFLSWCGRQSLFIYLLHQPILAAQFELYTLLTP